MVARIENEQLRRVRGQVPQRLRAGGHPRETILAERLIVNFVLKIIVFDDEQMWFHVLTGSGGTGGRVSGTGELSTGKMSVNTLPSPMADCTATPAPIFLASS
jgi:hypothetical protein